MPLALAMRAQSRPRRWLSLSGGGRLSSDLLAVEFLNCEGTTKTRFGEHKMATTSDANLTVKIILGSSVCNIAPPSDQHRRVIAR